MQGLLVVGHGTRDPQGIDEFIQTVRWIAERCHPEPVEPCFLELAAPTIHEGVDALVRRGVPVTKKQIELAEPIKAAGFYKVPVRVGHGIVAHVDVNVITTK